MSDYQTLGALMRILITEPPYGVVPLQPLNTPRHSPRSRLTKPEVRARKAKNKAQRKARQITRKNP